VVAVVGAI
jgi:hypothetical protein